MSIANILPYVVKAFQIGRDVTELAIGISEYQETLPGDRKPIEKIVAGVVRVVFSGVEMGGHLKDVSDKTFSIIKNIETGVLGGIVFPCELFGTIDDYVEGKISGFRALEKGTGSLASVCRAGLESAIYTEKYYLGLTDEERSKEYRWVLKPDSDLEDPEYERRPIIVEECERNLKNAQEGILPIGIAEVSLRMGLLSLTIRKSMAAYRQLAQLIRRPRNLPPIGQQVINHVQPPQINNVQQPPINNIQLPQDPFDLLRFEVIPEELENDIIFNRFVCPLTRLPVRDPVGDPTQRNRNGEVIGSVYERKVLVNWVQQHHTSPTTNQPLQIHQLIAKPSLKRLIDQRLKFYGNRLRRLAIRQVNKNEVSQLQQNLLQDALNETEGF